MAKKRQVQSNGSSNTKVKKGGGLLLFIAMLVLVANAILSERGSPLPPELVDLAEGVVTESQEQGQAPDQNVQTEAHTPTPTSQAATNTPQSQATKTPSPITQNTQNTSPWLKAEGDFDYYVLALSWQSAFCEDRPNKVECRTQTQDRYDANNFVLHGLWPNKKNDPKHTFGYCDVSAKVIQQDKSSNWCTLPALDLSETVETDLVKFMPGSASCLQNHEWYKHGTCAGMSADAYFALSNHLVDLFASTRFNQYVAERIGQTVSRRELLDVFSLEFGQENGDFLSLRCNEVKGKSLLSEIQIVLNKDLGPLTNFGEVFPTEKIRPQGNCPQSFNIDAAG